MDYAENILAIDQLRKQAHDALLKRDWKKTMDLADDIIVASRGIRGYCLNQMEQEHAQV